VSIPKLYEPVVRVVGILAQGWKTRFSDRELVSWAPSDIVHVTWLPNEVFPSDRCDFRLDVYAPKRKDRIYHVKLVKGLPPVWYHLERGAIVRKYSQSGIERWMCDLFTFPRCVEHVDEEADGFAKRLIGSITRTSD
jgi:hypothetical protein